MADQNMMSALLYPDIQQQLLQNQQAQAYAQALIQQGMEGAPQGRMAGQVYVQPSWTQQLAQAIKPALGMYMQQQNNASTAALAQKQADALRAMFVGASQSQSPDSMPAGAPATSFAVSPAPSQQNPTPQGGGFLLPGMTPQQGLMAYAMNPQGYMAEYLKQFQPTDQMKNWRAQGINPTEMGGFTRAAAAKEGILPVRPDQSLYSIGPDGKPVLNAVAPNPENNQQYSVGPAGVSSGPVPGAVANKAAMSGATAGATAGAEAPYKLVNTYDPATQQPSTGYAGNVLMPPGRPQLDLGRLQQAAAANGDSSYAYNIGGQRGTVGPQPTVPTGAPLGAGATAEATAKNAVESWNDLHQFATTSAPRNIGLLQSISQLADKTLVGPGSSQVQFVNGVLNTLGITPGSNQAQNYQIMSKNLNMLVGSQRMASGSGGTDALQTLLQAANPNNKEMNAPALKEAAQELVAYNRMQMAFDKAIPNPATASPQQTQEAQTRLSPLADPRLWQLEHAADDKERMRILSLVPPEERQQLLRKAAQARQMGLLN